MAGRSFPKKNFRAYTDIVFACLFISIPLLILSAGLLGIMYAFRVVQPKADLSYPEPSDGVDIDPSAYLVNYSATILITIASWTSSAAPLLPGFVMTLISFPAARRFLRSSLAGQEHDLPTPYQLGLYLQILTGGVGSLWPWFKYRFWSKRESRETGFSCHSFSVALEFCNHGWVSHLRRPLEQLLMLHKVCDLGCRHLATRYNVNCGISASQLCTTHRVT